MRHPADYEMPMFLRRNVHEGQRVPLSIRLPNSVKERLATRAERAGYTASAAAAELLELALDLEVILEPFQPAIDRLMREENLTLAQAIERLMWMDVETNPRPCRSPEG